MSQEASQPSPGFYEWNGHEMGHTRIDFAGTFNHYVEGRQMITMNMLIVTVLENYEKGMSENFLQSPVFGFEVRNPPTGGHPQPIFRIAKNRGKMWIGRPSKEDVQKWDPGFQLYPFLRTWIPEAFTGPDNDKSGLSTKNQVTAFAKSVLRDHVWVRSPGREFRCWWWVDESGWKSAHFGLDPTKCFELVDNFIWFDTTF